MDKAKEKKIKKEEPELDSVEPKEEKVLTEESVKPKEKLEVVKEIKIPEQENLGDVNIEKIFKYDKVKKDRGERLDG